MRAFTGVCMPRQILHNDNYEMRPLDHILYGSCRFRRGRPFVTLETPLMAKS